MTRRQKTERLTMNFFVFVLIIIGMGIVGRWGSILLGALRDRSRSKKENAALKEELKAALNEMAEMRQRFDSQYANVTLALDDLRSQTAAQLQLPDEQRERETLALEQTRTDDGKE